MTLEEAIDRNVELKGELVREGRLEKAKSVQLSIEAMKAILTFFPYPHNYIGGPLPGETKGEQNG